MNWLGKKNFPNYVLLLIKKEIKENIYRRFWLMEKIIIHHKRMDVNFILFDWNYRIWMYALTIKQTKYIMQLYILQNKLHFSLIHTYIHMHTLVNTHVHIKKFLYSLILYLYAKRNLQPCDLLLHLVTRHSKRALVPLT